MNIDVVNETDLDVDTARAAALARFGLGFLHIHPAAELSVMFIDEAAMADLHVQWMDEPGPTDVMSFPMDELRPGTAGSVAGPGTLGDIVICPSVAAAQAHTAGHPVQHEIDILLAHGLLHLVGFDHAEAGEEQEMFALQEDMVRCFTAQGGAA